MGFNTKLDRTQNVADHQRMKELLPWRPVDRHTEGAKHLFALSAQFVDRRHVTSIDRLPLLRGPVQIAVVVEDAKALDKRDFVPADKRMHECGAKIAVAIEQYKNLKVARAERKRFAGRLAVETGTPRGLQKWGCLHTLTSTRPKKFEHGSREQR